MSIRSQVDATITRVAGYTYRKLQSIIRKWALPIQPTGTRRSLVIAIIRHFARKWAPQIVRIQKTERAQLPRAPCPVSEIPAETLRAHEEEEEEEPMPTPVETPTPVDVLSCEVREFKTDDFVPTGRPVRTREYQYMVSKEDRDPSTVLEICEHNPQFIVHNEVGRSFTVLDSVADFKEWFACPNTPRTLHEVILGDRPQKLKFDIDAEVEKLATLPDYMPAAPRLVPDADSYNDHMLYEHKVALAEWKAMTPLNRKARRLFDVVTNAIESAFSDVYGNMLFIDEFDLAVSDSTDHTKFSRHIVLHRYYVANYAEATFFTEQVLAHLPAEYHQFLDATVNASRHNFRLPFCHKEGSTRVKRCYIGCPDDMIVSDVSTALPLPQKVAKKDQTHAYPEVEVTDENIKAALEISAEYTEGFAYDGCVGTLLLFKRLKPTHCILCDRVHDKNHTLMIGMNNGCAWMHCRHNKGAYHRIGSFAPATVAKPRMYTPPKDFKPFAPIPESFVVEKYHEDHIRDYNFHGGKYDTLLIKAHMGTGKTKKLLEYIDSLPEDHYVVVVSFRQTFTDEICKKLGRGFVNYRKIKGDIKDPRSVIQFESLHHLQLPVGRQVLLVLDESESIVGQVENPCMLKNKTLRSCWEKFEWLMTNCQQLIALDALANFRTYKLLELTRKSVLMQINTFTRLKAVNIDYKSMGDFLAKFYAAAAKAAEEPFVVVSTSKEQADVFAKEIRKRCPAARIREYNSSSTAEERKDFSDVNTAWEDIDVVIYTSTLSAGCSFEKERFKRIFGYFVDMSNDYQTAIQMLGRVRDIASGEFHTFIKESGNELPDTVPEVERVLARQEEIGGVLTNPLDMPKMINAVGDHEFKLKDLYYHVHVGNIVHRCQSRNHFRWYFQSCITAMGMEVRTIDNSNETDGLNKENYINRAEVRAVTHQMVADSEPLESEQIEVLAHKDILTPAEHASMTAHNLMSRYSVPREKITAEFVAKYDKSTTKRVFSNLERVAGQEQSIQESVQAWRVSVDQLAADKTESIDVLGRNEGLRRCMFAVDVINGLMDQADSPYCRGVDHFDAKKVPRADIEARIDGVVAALKADVGLVSMLFDIKRSRITAERDTLKSKLAVVNTIIGTTFGVKLKSTGKRGRGTNFTLTPSALFTWDADAGRYVVA